MSSHWVSTNSPIPSLLILSVSCGHAAHVLGVYSWRRFVPRTLDGKQHRSNHERDLCVEGTDPGADTDSHA